MTAALDTAGLRAAVDANPADGALRLVYADWLAEQGDDAGALVQREVAGVLAHPGGWERGAWQVLFDCHHGYATTVSVAAGRVGVHALGPDEEEADYFCLSVWQEVRGPHRGWCWASMAAGSFPAGWAFFSGGRRPKPWVREAVLAAVEQALRVGGGEAPA